ncbi:Transcriptional regulator KdgR [bioreactor metagenome]|uniref:Transcriptional regulator KdgR n=1 Tax=bioreactor metagenome TaxID=1076179 RepID=A0A645EA67_9ZZZZ
MLAYMPDAFLEEYLSKPLTASTGKSITDPDLLRAEIMRIRTLGYATDNMEDMIGISCVAVPILDRSKNVLGALSISGPSPRFSDDRVKELAQLLKEHVRVIQSGM